MQGSDNNPERGFYKYALSHLKSGYSVLDLGSGMDFFFEKFFLVNGDSNVRFTCCDLFDISKEKYPTNVTNYLKQSITEKFDLKKKFDAIVCFEVIEHLSDTDTLINNCLRHLKKGGILIISHPNLASAYSRLELLFGYQPHILEPCNSFPNSGMGIFGQKNNPQGHSVNHVKGFTYSAMKEMLKSFGFSIVEALGHDYYWLKYISKKAVSIAPTVIIVARLDKRHNIVL